MPSETLTWTKADWDAARVRATKRNPCPVCKKPDWCSDFPTLGRTCCMRVESDKPCRNGGWWHLSGEAVPVRQLRPVPVKERKLEPVQWAYMLSCWPTTIRMLVQLAEGLGIDPVALQMLGACWAAEHRAWAFPMRDGAGRVCGVRLRNVAGDKWAVTGSQAGLFVPDWRPELPAASPLYIVEGPTDCAAALTIGLPAIGRPSCLGQEQTVNETIRRLAIREVVIVSDNDGPGVRGSLKLQEALRVPSRIWTPCTKDIRGFVQAGGDRETVAAMVRDIVPSQPKEGC